MIAALALTLATSLGDCALEGAIVDVVPPATFRVLATLQCGGLTCWERWVETEGKRTGSSRVCEVPGSEHTRTGLSTGPSR